MLRNQRVAVIGYFGIGLNLANGQTIKTKTVTDEIENYSVFVFFYFDK